MTNNSMSKMPLVSHLTYSSFADFPSLKTFVGFVDSNDCLEAWLDHYSSEMENDMLKHFFYCSPVSFHTDQVNTYSFENLLAYLSSVAHHYH